MRPSPTSLRWVSTPDRGPDRIVRLPEQLVNTGEDDEEQRPPDPDIPALDRQIEVAGRRVRADRRDVHQPGAGGRRSLGDIRGALGLDGLCRFHDPVRDVVPLYNALDGIFQPSTYEGLSNVVIEAQACGTPVALSAEGDNDGLVTQGKTGITFRAADRRETVRAMEELIRLGKDAEAREEITSRARAAVVERFSLEGEIRKLQGTYEQLLGEGGE